MLSVSAWRVAPVLVFVTVIPAALTIAFDGSVAVPAMLADTWAATGVTHKTRKSKKRVMSFKYYIVMGKGHYTDDKKAKKQQPLSGNCGLFCGMRRVASCP